MEDSTFIRMYQPMNKDNQQLGRRWIIRCSHRSIACACDGK